MNLIFVACIKTHTSLLSLTNSLKPRVVANPYLVGTVPYVVKAGSKSSNDIVLEIFPIRGHLMYLIRAKHPKKKDTDGFMPHMYKLIEELKVVGEDEIMEAFKKEAKALNIGDWAFVRGPDGEPKKNATPGKITPGVEPYYYSQKYMLVFNDAATIGLGMSAEEMLLYLKRVVSLVQRVHDVANKGGYPSTYAAATSVMIRSLSLRITTCWTARSNVSCARD